MSSATINKIKATLEKDIELALALTLDHFQRNGNLIELEDEIIMLKLRLNAGEETEKIKVQLQNLIETLNIKPIDFRTLEAEVHNLKNETKLRAREIVGIKNLKKNFASSKFKIQANDIKLNLGKIYCLVGENASGKSTFLNILAGNLKHDNGKLAYNFWEKNKHQQWLAIKRNIAYVPQNIIPWKGSLLDNLLYTASIRGLRGKENQKTVSFIIHRLGLLSHVDKRWKALSGGYKLRFALAQALISGAELIILDEPLSNLDINTQRVVLNDISNLAKSTSDPKTFLITGQHIHEMEEISDVLLYVNNGTLTNLGEKNELNNDRDSNLFEFQTGFKFLQIKLALEDYDELILKQLGNYLILRTPLNYSLEKVTTLLNKCELPYSYIRDISKSLKSKFYEKYLR